MKIFREKFLRACINKCTKKGNNNNASTPSAAVFESCWEWLLTPSSIHENKAIPQDVPKGHLVVYVGVEETLKRYVININLLNHPLFQALLDHAQEVYDFGLGSKLCIPCDENIFLSVVQCAMSPQNNRRVPICLR